MKQYQQDVICQMTARYYATLFNQQLYHAGKVTVPCVDCHPAGYRSL